MKLFLLILILFAPIKVYGDDSICSKETIPRTGAIRSVLSYTRRERGEILDPEKNESIFDEDIDSDGRKDLFVSYNCGNHSCLFSVFLSTKGNSYCPLEGEIFLTAGAAKRILKSEKLSPGELTLVVFEGASGVTSGTLAKYRVKLGKIERIKQAFFDTREKSEDDALRELDQEN